MSRRGPLRGLVVAALVPFALTGPTRRVLGATALDLLRASPAPRFREGHTLPPLTRWGWSMPFEVRVELARNWGYALEMGEANASLVKKLDDPESVPSRLCALAAAEPERYRLCVLTYRPCNRKEFGETLPDETWCRDAEGNVIREGKRRTWSPEAPLEVFERAAALGVAPLKEIQKRAPVAVILNGGEYALGVYGHSGKVWKRDPAVLAAKGERSWLDYVSERKAGQEAVISDAFRDAAPDRELYIYYYADGCPHRNRYGHWHVWAWEYRWMRAVSDLPSSSIYYRHFNSGWTGGSDILTQSLNSVTQQLALGDPLSYNWVCGGWTREKMGDEALSDHARYVGFLKCLYAAGMTGGIAGYFSYPKGGFGRDLGDKPPSWLTQMIALARVHALFSHLEEFLRGGDLLPGPNWHRWSKDLPACELPTGDPDARVIARKRLGRYEWLVAAWAAGGDDREVTVTIPGLGEVCVLVRPCGSVYRAELREGKPSLSLVDRDGLLPTAAVRSGER